MFRSNSNRHHGIGPLLLVHCSSELQSVQDRLQSVQSPDEIVAIAAEKGYQISVLQLSLFSKRLRASHWVWSNQSEQWRHNFFGLADDALEKNQQPSQTAA